MIKLYKKILSMETYKSLSPGWKLIALVTGPFHYMRGYIIGVFETLKNI